MNIDDRRPQGPFTDSHIFQKFQIAIYNSATRQPIPFMFGSKMGFSGTADRTAPFPVDCGGNGDVADVELKFEQETAVTCVTVCHMLITSTCVSDFSS